MVGKSVGDDVNVGVGCRVADEIGVFVWTSVGVLDGKEVAGIEVSVIVMGLVCVETIGSTVSILEQPMMKKTKKPMDKQTRSALFI